MDINESDWKKWKALRLTCIDDFCEETFSKVRKLADSDEPIHEKHRKLYRLVEKRDREIVALFDPMKRSSAILQLVNLYRTERIGDKDVNQFSEALCAFLQDRKSL